MRKSMSVCLERMSLFSGWCVIHFLQVNKNNKTGKDSQKSTKDQKGKREEKKFCPLVIAAESDE